MARLRLLEVDASAGKIREVSVQGLGPIDAGVRLHLEHETYNHDPLGPENILLIAKGPFTLTPLLGAHRLVAVFRSPETRGLHASTLGGAAYALARTGLDGFLVRGRSSDPLIVYALDRGGGLETGVIGIERDKLWRAYRGYRGYTGARALHELVREELGPKLRGLEYRILLVGPAAWHTPYAGIFSWVPMPDGSPGPVVDSASRGGGGSVMARAHGVAAIVFGGPRRVGPLVDKSRVLRVLEDALGEPYYRAVEKATRKYRFDPKLGTGGTFGVNYVHYRELIPALAYNTIYMSRSVRLMLHEKIMRWFWAPFQEEVFARSGPKPWRTCGEPCSVACKKVYKDVKLDYEPAHALGPMIGVITLDDTRRLVELADDLGVDAIEAGHIIAWIFDAVARGLLDESDAGLDGKPVLDPLALSPETSRANAVLAERVLRSLATPDTRVSSMIAAWGARRTARMLDEEHRSRVERTGWGFRDLLVYAAFGSEGYMTPNYYWSPGMIAPLYVLGRYWTNYSPAYMEPEEYARQSLHRAVKELLIDNAGMCRFHRKWAEKVLDALYREILGVDVELVPYALDIYRRIREYSRRAGAEPVPWESRKTMDIVATIAAELGVKGWEAIPPREKLLEWWHRFYSELNRLLDKGLED